MKGVGGKDTTTAAQTVTAPGGGVQQGVGKKKTFTLQGQFKLTATGYRFQKAKRPLSYGKGFTFGDGRMEGGGELDFLSMGCGWQLYKVPPQHVGSGPNRFYFVETTSGRSLSLEGGGDRVALAGTRKDLSGFALNDGDGGIGGKGSAGQDPATEFNPEDGGGDGVHMPWEVVPVPHHHPLSKQGQQQRYYIVCRCSDTAGVVGEDEEFGDPRWGRMLGLTAQNHVVLTHRWTGPKQKHRPSMCPWELKKAPKRKLAGPGLSDSYATAYTHGPSRATAQKRLGTTPHLKSSALGPGPAPSNEEALPETIDGHSVMQTEAALMDQRAEESTFGIGGDDAFKDDNVSLLDEGSVGQYMDHGSPLRRGGPQETGARPVTAGSVLDRGSPKMPGMAETGSFVSSAGSIRSKGFIPGSSKFVSGRRMLRSGTSATGNTMASHQLTWVSQPAQVPFVSGAYSWNSRHNISGSDNNVNMHVDMRDYFDRPRVVDEDDTSVVTPIAVFDNESLSMAVDGGCSEAGPGIQDGAGSLIGDASLASVISYGGVSKSCRSSKSPTYRGHDARRSNIAVLRSPYLEPPIMKPLRIDDLGSFGKTYKEPTSGLQQFLRPKSPDPAHEASEKRWNASHHDTSRPLNHNRPESAAVKQWNARKGFFSY